MTIITGRIVVIDPASITSFSKNNGFHNMMLVKVT